MIDRDHDHVVLPRKFGSVVADERARPRGISASVQPHHHRPLRRASAAGRPKIQDQAVLAHRPARIHRCEFRYHNSAELAVKLGRAQPVRGRFAHTAPRHRPRRRQEASAPGRRRAVRNALEAVHLPVGEFCAANLTGGSLDDRARCRAIAQRFAKLPLIRAPAVIAPSPIPEPMNDRRFISSPPPRKLFDAHPGAPRRPPRCPQTAASVPLPRNSCKAELRSAPATFVTPQRPQATIGNVADAQRGVRRLAPALSTRGSPRGPTGKTPMPAKIRVVLGNHRREEIQGSNFQRN